MLNPKSLMAQEEIAGHGETIEQIIHISEQLIANPAFLETEEWNSFKQELRSGRLNDLNAEEFRDEFLKIRNESNLPFTHYSLFLQRPYSSGDDEPMLVEVKEIDHKTVNLRVRSFDADAEMMVSAVHQIHAGNYENLIIDLRGNQGGSFPSVVVLGRYLTNEMLDTGVFLTRKWFASHGDYPSQEQLSGIPVLQKISLDEFSRQLQTGGAVRLVLPPHSDPTFSGNVYILIDGQTASAGEPFVYLTKQTGMATIIGERTAGAMLSGERIPINETLTLFLPIADYMTADGHRIDRVGVEPDIKVTSEEALKRTLEIITGK